MKIDMLKIIPDDWTVEKVNKNYVKVFYKTKGRGSSPKPFILPKDINVNREFIESCAMYLGDGKLSEDTAHLEFCSKDRDMVLFMIKFFDNFLNVKNKDMTFSLRHGYNFKNPIKEWSIYLGISEKNIHVRKSKRHREGSFSLQINGTIMRNLFGRILEKIVKNKDIIINKELRRAFLRGLFAAEGSIGINQKENYIVYIDYCLSYEETKLIGLCSKMLRLEKVKYKINEHKKNNSTYIRITGWKNYYRYWKIGVFNLCERKRKQFIKKMKSTKFNLSLNEDFMRKLINPLSMSRRQLALKLNLYPSILCNLNKGKSEYINLKDVIKLIKFNNISFDTLRGNITKIRVNQTTRINDKSILDDLLE